MVQYAFGYNEPLFIAAYYCGGLCVSDIPDSNHPILPILLQSTRNWIVCVLDLLYVSFHSAVEAGVTDSMLEGGSVRDFEEDFGQARHSNSSRIYCMKPTLTSFIVNSTPGQGALRLVT